MVAGIQEPVCAYLKGSRYSPTNRRLLEYIESVITARFSAHFSANAELFRNALIIQAGRGSGTAILCGGDGMAHHGVQVLAGTPVALLPLPGGTANDFSRELGWSPVHHGPARVEYDAIDCIRINNRFLVTVGGCGNVAEVVRDVEKVRAKYHLARGLWKVLGKWIYAAASIGVMTGRSRRERRYLIHVNGGRWEGSSASVLVCNQGTFAGTFTVCRSSGNSDGVFEIVILDQASQLSALARGLGSILLKTPLSRDLKRVFVTDKAVIELRQGDNTLFFADGELLPVPADLKYNISMKPKYLKVVRRK